MPSRRTFLRVLAIGSGACAVIACGVNVPTFTVSGIIPAGNVSDLAIGTLVPVTGEHVAIARDEAGLYAMSLVCTHTGCDIALAGGEVDANRVVCACHGSIFDGNGEVLHGPARTPLPHYAVTVAASGAITIDGDMEVDAATRTAVPGTGSAVVAAR